MILLMFREWGICAVHKSVIQDIVDGLDVGRDIPSIKFMQISAMHSDHTHLVLISGAINALEQRRTATP